MKAKMEISLALLGWTIAGGIFTSFTSHEALASWREPAFVPNQGQYHPDVQAVIRLPGLDLWITQEGDLIQDFYRVVGESPESMVRQGHVVALRWLTSDETHDAQNKLRVEYRNPVSWKINFFRGQDPARWVTGVQPYQEMWIRELYPGVSLRLYLDQGHARYDLVLAPGVDPSVIRFTLEGAESWRVQEEALVFTTRFGEIVHGDLRAYQIIQGTRVELPAYFVQRGNVLQVQVEGVHPDYPLVIDPVIFSTFLGGSSAENIMDIRRVGNTLYLAGHTTSSNFPQGILGGYDVTYNSSYDGVVAILSLDGNQLLAMTYLGGNGSDYIYEMGISQDGRVMVGGTTYSSDFPVVNPLDPTLTGSPDGFVAVFSADLLQLQFSTYLGGSSSDYTTSVEFAQNGDLLVCGYTRSTNFPVINAADPSYNGWDDFFVMRIDSGATTILFSTYLGSSSFDYCREILESPSGDIYVVGYANGSIVFPQGYDLTWNGSYDVVVARFSASGALLSGTFLGGSSGDYGQGLAIDDQGNVYVAGYTGGIYPTTPGAYDGTPNGSNDIVVSVLDATLQTLIYSTYIGGSGSDIVGFGRPLVVTPDSFIYIVGYSNGATYPLARPEQSFQGSYDVVISKLDWDANVLRYSTFWGGSASSDYGVAIDIDGRGEVYVAGYTYSSNFPIVGDVVDSTLVGTPEGFVARFFTCPLLNVYVAPSDTVCSGDEVMLWAEGDKSFYASVSWSGGVMDSVPFTITTTTTFTLTASQPEEGCLLTIDQEIFVHPLPDVQANAYPAPQVCKGDQVVLYGSGGADVYTWIPPFVSDGVPFVPLASSSYIVQGEDLETGCVNTDTIFVQVIEVNPSILISGDTLYAQPAGADAYQWYYCESGGLISALPGETNPYFIPAQGGSYAVEVTVQGCSELSPCFLISGIAWGYSSTREQDQLPFRVYSDGQNQITLVILQAVDGDISLYSADGKEIQRVCGNTAGNLCTPGLWTYTIPVPGSYFVVWKSAQQKSGVSSVRSVPVYLLGGR